MAITMDELTDAQYDLADRIEQAMEAEPTKSWTSSGLGRKVYATTTEVYAVLRWMVANQYATSAGNGAWTRYSLPIHKQTTFSFPAT